MTHIAHETVLWRYLGLEIADYPNNMQRHAAADSKPFLNDILQVASKSAASPFTKIRDDAHGQRQQNSLLEAMDAELAYQKAAEPVRCALSRSESSRLQHHVDIITHNDINSMPGGHDHHTFEHPGEEELTHKIGSCT